MSRRISLNLELNKKLSRASNHTPVSDKSIESVNSACSKFSAATLNGSRLKESIVKTRELVRSRISGRSNTNKSLESADGFAGRPIPSPKINDYRTPDRQSLTNKLNLKKYSTFLMKKMQSNDFLNSLLIDRTPTETNLMEMIERDQIEPALLLTLQLLCDLVVHCEGTLQLND
jgi:hypothetical protein